MLSRKKKQVCRWSLKVVCKNDVTFHLLFVRFETMGLNGQIASMINQNNVIACKTERVTSQIKWQSVVLGGEFDCKKIKVKVTSTSQTSPPFSNDADDTSRSRPKIEFINNFLLPHTRFFSTFFFFTVHDELVRRIYISEFVCFSFENFARKYSQKIFLFPINLVFKWHQDSFFLTLTKYFFLKANFVRLIDELIIKSANKPWKHNFKIYGNSF
jgi:hypothetical protein